jgi:hypothetical protein
MFIISDPMGTMDNYPDGKAVCLSMKLTTFLHLVLGYPYVFIKWYLIMHKNNFTFRFIKMKLTQLKHRRNVQISFFNLYTSIYVW